MPRNGCGGSIAVPFTTANIIVMSRENHLSNLCPDSIHREPCPEESPEPVEFSPKTVNTGRGSRPSVEPLVDATGQDQVNLEIGAYYDSVQWVYDLGLWVYNLGSRKKKAHSVHYGVWLKGTKSMVDALLNVDLLAAEELNLGPDDLVLDAGCGIGGTSVLLASKYGCRVVGITVSDRQLMQARRAAKKAGADDRVSFMKMDYTRTKFPDETFTKVVGIESICYAWDKRQFVDEAFRVLKRNGILVVTDAFLKRAPASEKEKTDLTTWYRGWKVPSLATAEEFGGHLRSSGFIVTRYADLTPGTIPTAKIIYNMTLPLYPLGLLLSKVNPSSPNLLGHIKASLSQIDLGPSNKDGIISYGMFVAQKER
jgi:tocopherol O-methyltransferase